jgi:hypothetical protein
LIKWRNKKKKRRKDAKPKYFDEEPIKPKTAYNMEKIENESKIFLSATKSAHQLFDVYDSIGCLNKSLGSLYNPRAEYKVVLTENV